MNRKLLLSLPIQEPAGGSCKPADIGSKTHNKQPVHLWNSLPEDTVRARNMYGSTKYTGNITEGKKSPASTRCGDTKHCQRTP